MIFFLAARFFRVFTFPQHACCLTLRPGIRQIGCVGKQSNISLFLKVLWNTFRWNQAVWNGEAKPQNSQNSMIQIVLNLPNSGPPEIESKLTALAKAQQDNPTVAPDLTLKPADLSAAAAAITAAIALKKRMIAAVKSAEQDIQDAAKAGRQVIRDYAADVLRATDKNPSKINLLGMVTRDTTAPNTPSTMMGEAPVLTLSYGPDAGSLKARSSRLKGTDTIEYEMNLTPNATPTWQHLITVKGFRRILTGLPPGALVQIRARGIFRAGPGPWSDVVEHRVP